MLGKLIKHEFNATARYFLPLFIVLIIITPVTAYMLKFNMDQTDSPVASIISGLSVVLYYFMLIGISITTTILIILRFYKNMVTDEAYLTFTLPVRVSSHILGKLIVAFVWSFASVLLFIASVLFYLVVLGAFSSPDLNQMILDAQNEMGFTFTSGIMIQLYIQIFIAIIISVTYSILELYSCISLGQLFKNHRVIGAIVWYIAINFATQIISSIFSISIMFTDFEKPIEIVKFFNNLLIINNIFMFICCFVFFFVTKYVLTKKLNLE